MKEHDAPPIEVGRHPQNALPTFWTRCPWCGVPTEECISWIAAWAQLVEHYGIAHRDVQVALKDAWRAATPSE